MAVYEYKCSSCETVKEKSFSITEEIPQFIDCDCGQCMQKQIPLPMIVFKGEGFAKNDLKKDKENK